jgi:hypothetical protein
MKNLTAEKVLRKAFEHLDQMLDEKNREVRKNSGGQQVAADSVENRQNGKRKVNNTTAENTGSTRSVREQNESRMIARPSPVT